MRWMVIINTADRPATCKAAWKGGRGRICQLIPPQRDNRGQSTIIPPCEGRQGWTSNSSGR